MSKNRETEALFWQYLLLYTVVPVTLTLGEMIVRGLRQEVLETRALFVVTVLFLMLWPVAIRQLRWAFTHYMSLTRTALCLRKK